MKILHTSDWHLGQNFMGKSREEEHKAFFIWLIDTINREKVDTLIVAGDIFDTGTPPNYALELYYNFLKNLKTSYCKNIVIIGGNHDSIATLKAPSKLLKILNINVIVSVEEDENSIVKIYNEDRLEGVVCAVPFLRDNIIRNSFSGLSSEDKEKALNEGIKSYYTKIYHKALDEIGGRDIPIIATGHLTTVGGITTESERDIYIGNMLNISSDFLADMFDYVALGHLHLNQKVKYEQVYYSGSPIPLSFSEATTQKRVNIVTFKGRVAKVNRVDIPLYRELYILKGNYSFIKESMEQIDDKDGWIEVYLEDDNNSQVTIQELYE